MAKGEEGTQRVKKGKNDKRSIRRQGDTNYWKSGKEERTEVEINRNEKGREDAKIIRKGRRKKSEQYQKNVRRE